MFAAVSGFASIFSWLGIGPRDVAAFVAAVGVAIAAFAGSAFCVAGWRQLRGHRGRSRLAVFAVSSFMVAVFGSISTFNTLRTHASVPPPRVSIEGDLKVANISRHEAYRAETTAEVGDVIAAQAWYYNREDVDSGREAKSLLVQIATPAVSGPTELRATIAGRNTNQVGVSASVALPNGARLRYRKGSAEWKHNPSDGDEHAKYVAERISDNVMATGDILEDAAPCINCEATVSVLFDVVAADG